MLAAESKAFPISDALSAATGILVSENGIGGVYEVLGWMTGESVYTHQIPRISREAAPVILAAHPQLAEAYEEAKRVNRENWREWLAIWKSRYGETLEVPKFTTAQHEYIDPISEIAATVHPDNLLVIKV